MEITKNINDINFINMESFHVFKKSWQLEPKPRSISRPTIQMKCWSGKGKKMILQIILQNPVFQIFHHNFTKPILPVPSSIHC